MCKQHGPRDIIGKINPLSPKQHAFVVVVTDYFKKWVEVVPLRTVSRAEVIKFLRENIMYLFDIPWTITFDHSSVFNGSLVREFADEYDIKILNSTPYYAHANGQAESTNKLLR